MVHLNLINVDVLMHSSLIGLGVLPYKYRKSDKFEMKFIDRGFIEMESTAPLCLR